ncbi:MAG TPA: alpha-amylase family glycosyl hydrolase, partial [Bacteroidales bacterium]|nr:alpha-amylase family glycosyl hydrolase [Bacteroidales bacterium]
QARQSPEWIRNGIMYQIQPRAFTPEGNLKAATVRLQELKRLGITIVYMCPVFVSDDDMDLQFWSPRQMASKMDNPRNPYRMKDYYHVDPEYGTDDDLKNFVSEAHRLGIKVMLDMVYLHCGPKAVFLKDNPDFIKRDPSGKVLNAAWRFPALNYENSELREYLWKNMEYWIRDFNVDGFRCDVADQIPIDFWETARDRLEKIKSDIGMLAEGSRPQNTVKAFDLNYSFSWFRAVRDVYQNGQPASSLRKEYEKRLSTHPNGTMFIHYIDNHDIANDSYYNRIEEVWTTKGANAAIVMTFTLDGVPMIYNGQEVADTARHSIFGRLPVKWELGNTPVGKERFALFQKLIKTRLTESSLIKGKVIWLDNDAPDAVISYARELNGQQIISVINLSGKPISVKLKDTSAKKAKPLFMAMAKGNLSKGFNLKGYGYWVGKSSGK